MAQFDGAVIREQGVNFAVVLVKPAILANRSEARKAIGQFGRVFGGLPVVLAAQDSRGVPTYLGRPDLSRFLASTPLTAIPWRRYSVS